MPFLSKKAGTNSKNKFLTKINKKSNPTYKKVLEQKERVGSACREEI